jgi:hypothetical protein
MRPSYWCARCGHSHSLESREGQRHLERTVSRELFGKAIDFTLNAGAYAYITQHSQEYVRDMQVFGVLRDKFSNAGMFQTPEAASNWLHEHLTQGQSGLDHLFRRLQGDGAGEVDVLRHINGSLRGILYETQFITGPGGHIASNTPGFDLKVVNRLTGAVVERIQVKSNWSTDPGTLRQVVRDFLSGEHYGGVPKVVEKAWRILPPRETILL